MSREQGPRATGMRPTANAAGRRQNNVHHTGSETEAAA